MIRRPPRSTRTDTLFPYTTLFRSALVVAVLLVIIHPDAGLDRQLIGELPAQLAEQRRAGVLEKLRVDRGQSAQHRGIVRKRVRRIDRPAARRDRKSTRLNSSH